ncbi:MAG: hypothetical protein LIO68_06860 [Rikenellaceae bacterium]|nr:hypothetical protein [Rikenellaceae bacterium]
MKKYHRRIFVLLSFLIFLSVPLTGTHAGNHSQKQSLQWIPFYWEGDTISGRYIGKAYLYVPVKIEDLPDSFSMQLDLGTMETQFYGTPLKPYLGKSGALAGKLGSFESDPNALFTDVDLQLGPVAMKADVWHRANFGEEIPRNPVQPNKPIHIGTIAPDLFRDKILIIDYKSSRFAITDRLPAKYGKLPAAKFESDNGIVKLPFRIDGKACQVMFDTGSSPFPLATSRERAFEISDSVVTDSLSGPLWWGREITFYGLEVTKPIELEGTAFRNGTVYYDKEGLWNDIYNSLNVWGLTGNAYFLDHTVILDYKNKLFRIK